jgi:hypothetical protein
MKKTQAYLAGTLFFAAVLASGSVAAQQDTIPHRDSARINRSDSNWHRQHNKMDSTRSNRNWNNSNARSNEDMPYTYIDLNNGDTLDYWYDTDKKTVMNRTTNLPVDLYINTYTGDTVYGRGRFVVNGLVLQGQDGKWKLDESKVKMDGDELKIKDGKRKLKIDGQDIKVKDGKNKIKSDEKQAKIKDGDTKAKVNNEEMKVKDSQGKAKYNKDGTKVKDGDTKTKKSGDSTKIKEQ